MKEETAKQAAELLHELDELQDIKNVTIREKDHWWGFITSDYNICNSNVVHMTKTLRREFINALDRSIEIVKQKIEKL